MTARCIFARWTGGRGMNGGQNAQRSEVALTPAYLDLAIEARLSGKVEGLLGCFTEDATMTTIGTIAGKPLVPELTGQEELRGFYNGFFARWDLSAMRVVRRFSDGNSAAIEISGTLVHKVTGQMFETSMCDLLEFQDGKIKRARCYSDTFSIVRIAGLAL
jgi:ketosteroid isomerase-like protein